MTWLHGRAIPSALLTPLAVGLGALPQQLHRR